MVFYEGQAYEFALTARGTVGARRADGEILAPMPGRVTAVEVSPGEKVSKGQRLLTLEAMKMEHGAGRAVRRDGRRACAEAGAQVAEGAMLAVIEAADVNHLRLIDGVERHRRRDHAHDLHFDRLPLFRWPPAALD